jgi:outer membrane biosynthesis protein TonB
MLPHTQARKKRNSSKVNLLISLTFHSVLVVALVYFAAHQGYLGHQLQKLSVDLVKPKPPEKPKEPEKPKVEQPKVEQPKVPEPPKVVDTAPKTVAPPASATPDVAPAPVELPSFAFAGGNAALSSDNPIELYKDAIQSAFQSKWRRPEDMNDDDYVAEVQVQIGRDGSITGSRWEKGSGNALWDDSVRAAIAAITKMSYPPPTNFPPRVTVCFDVQQETGTVLP